MQTNILTIPEEGKPEWQKIINHLKRKKMYVHTVSTLNEAYKKLRSEPINIILSDYHLPKIKISTFLNKIKTIRPDVELIFLSDNTTLSNAIDAMKGGAYDFKQENIRYIEKL